MANDHESLNANAWLLHCNNGTLDLKTGTLQPHSPDDLITRSTRCDYEGPDQVSEVFECFLRRILPDDAVRGFVQRLLGLSLIGQQLDICLRSSTAAALTAKERF